MMRYRSSRPAALFLAVVFLLLGAGDLFGLHACPHHDGVSAPHAAMVAGEADDADHHAAHDTELPAGENAHSGPCVCGGSCPAGSLVPFASSTFSVVELFPLLAQPLGMQPQPVDRSYVLPFILPYGNAPPLIG